MNETEKRDRRDEKEEIRYHVIFYGQVQGVGFRYRAYYAAYQLGLTGWVRNCWDEVNTGIVKIKNMKTGEQVERNIEEITKKDFFE